MENVTTYSHRSYNSNHKDYILLRIHQTGESDHANANLLVRDYKPISRVYKNHSSAFFALR